MDTENKQDEFQPDIPFSKEEAQAITQGEGLWKKLNEGYKERKPFNQKDFEEALYKFMADGQV